MLHGASYALEMLSYGGLRSHAIGSALVSDDTVELLYYDHRGSNISLTESCSASGNVEGSCECVVATMGLCIL